MNVRSSRTALALLVAASSLAFGCSSSSDGDKVGNSRASLHRAKDCTDLLGELKADASFKVNHAIDQQIGQIKACIAHNDDANCAYGGYVGVSPGGSFGEGDSAGQAVDDSSAEPPAAADPGSGTGTGNSGSDSPTSGSSGDGKSSDQDSADSHSDTNTQVAGVDEADIVKTDGANIYLVHGNTFKVIKAWPATDLSIVSSIDIEGSPTEMFVEGNAVVIYSTVNGASVYAAAGVAPKEAYSDYGYAYAAKEDAAVPRGGSYGTYSPLTKITVLTLAGGAPSVARELYFEGNYLDSRRVGPHVRTVLNGYVHGPKLLGSVYELFNGSGNDPGVAPGNPGQPPVAMDGGSAEPQPPLDAGQPTPAEDAGSDDGGSAEQDAGSADEDAGPAPGFLSLHTTDWTPGKYPTTGTEMIQALEELRKRNLDLIGKSQLSDWLPYSFVKEGAQTTAKTVACGDFYVPTAGSTESGFTEVASIDLSNPSAAPKETAILGQAATVYGSADTLYLATNAWVEPPIAWATGGGGDTVASPPPDANGGTSSGGGSTGSGGADTPSAEPAPKPAGVRPLADGTTQATIVTSTNKTHVHKFEFASDPTFPNYVASGTVVGSVKNQFSLDDKDGKLRIATTESRFYTTADGQWVQSSWEPGNTVNPANVNHLFVLGQNGGFLDTIGDVGDLAPNEQIYSARFVGTRGYIVTFRQIDPLFVIDLANPAQPTLLGALKIPGFSEYMHPLDDNHLLTIGRNATTEGRTQGLALKIFDVTNGAAPKVDFEFNYTGDEYGSSDAEYDHKAFTYFADKNLLAFPYYAYTQSGAKSTLELFHVDLTTGFSKLGSIDASKTVSNPYGYCGGYYGPSVRRGVFLEDFAYAISYGGIVAKDTNDLAAPGVELPLPAPTIDPGYYGGPVCADGPTATGGEEPTPPPDLPPSDG